MLLMEKLKMIYKDEDNIGNSVVSNRIDKHSYSGPCGCQLVQRQMVDGGPLL